MRQAVVVLLLIGTGAPILQSAYGQEDPRDRRRRLIEGVLKTLVESQLDNKEDRNLPRPNPRPGDARTLREARGNVQQFSVESSRLIQHLRHEERLNNEIRPLLGDALKVQAAGNVLLQRSPALDASRLAAEFAALDRQWRNVSHKLRQIDLNRECVACIKRLDGYDQQLCELLNVQPQVDRTELIRVCAVLGRDLQNLLEDISIDVRSVQARHALLLEGRKLKSEVDRLGVSAARTAGHQDLVAQFQPAYARWRKLAGQLAEFENAYLNRSIGRIEDSNDRIHDLLWLAKAVDRNELLALTRGIQKGVVGLASNISAAELLTLPEPQAALAKLQSLLTLCGGLETSIAGGSDLDSLLWDFRILAVEWEGTKKLVQPLRRPELQQWLAATDHSLASLGQRLGQTLEMDEQAAITLAASVDDLADELLRVLPQVLGKRYPGQTRAAILGAAAEFHKHAHQFYDDLTRRRDADHLRAHCQELARAWASLSEHLDRLEPAGRQALGASSGRIAQDVARLQILYAY